MLHTLYNLGPAPEPNLTVFWSPRLPDGFKRFAIKTSIDTSAIQYESDDLMRPKFGDDCAIACCVSAMRVGKQMQFFGARVNLPKTLLYALNGGRDEMSGDQVGPKLAPVTGDVLNYDEVMDRLDPMMDWLAKTYVNALNCIHYMHDKYCYEAIEMALHDRDILRTLACGIAGLSHATDSLSAIKHAKVRPVRDTRGLIVDFQIDGEFPCFGNNDDQADDIAKKLVSTMMNKIRMYPSYRGATHTQSVLTITSNVVYGKATGNTPDGRKKGEPFAPGANPSNGRDTHGALAALMSVAKIPYDDAEDGISLTLSVVPSALGSVQEQMERGVNALDAYFSSGGFHVNINVLNRDTLQDAMKHPEKYPQLTIRVSGYAVNFVKLTREQQLDVINRTFHGSAVGKRTMSDMRSGSRYELLRARKGVAETKAAGDYYAVHPGDIEEIKEEDDLVGYVHSYEVGSTVDGPGLRFVGFLTGCLLRCQYCHNPDTWHKHNGRPVTVSRAMQQIGKYVQVLKISKGGITLSGGEPMVQKPFVLRIFRRCKELGLHTCMDTSGRLGDRFTDQELMDIDLNLLDIKSGDPETYEKVTHQPLKPTLDYAHRLSALGRPMWVRFVLVPGLTDAWDNVEKVADICAGLKSLQRVEILRFHQMGKIKWEKLGLDYPLANVEPPSAELSERVRGQFRSRGLTVY